MGSTISPAIRGRRLAGALVAGALGLGCSSSDASDPGAGGAGAGAAGAGAAGGGAGGAGAAGGGAGATGACPQADSMLDMSLAPGAGAAFPKPAVTATCTEAAFVVDTNGMPGFAFVAMTPNALVEHPDHWELPLAPSEAAEPTPIPLLGTVGFAVNGLPFFGPNEGPVPPNEAFGDPIYNRIVDECLGHTADRYHHHAFEERCLTPSGLVERPWMNPDPDPSLPSPILGWALDGFPIYGSRECADAECTTIVTLQSGWGQVGDPQRDAWDAYTWSEHTADASYLDECNGHRGPDGSYHYHATGGFPYLIGCYRGVP